MGKGSGGCGERPGLAMDSSAARPAGSSESFQGQLFKIGAAVTEGVIDLLSGKPSSPAPSGKTPPPAPAKSSYEPDEAQLAADELSKRAGKHGTWKTSDGGKGLDRPNARCIECGYLFTSNDAFHWTDNGPIHGWGKYGETGVCSLAKKEYGKPKDKGASKKDNFIRCEECGEIVYKDQPYHFIEGGAVHGKGGREDLGTCLIAHRGNLTEALMAISEDFYDGKITPEQMLQYMQETHEVETAMAERIEAATKKHKPAASSSSSSSSSSTSSASTDGGSPEIDDVFDAMEPLMEAYLQDENMTLDEYRVEYADEYRQWHDIYEPYEGSLPLHEVHDLMQNRIFDEDEEATGFGPDSPCHCGSGKTYEDCHEAEDEMTGFSMNGFQDADIPSVHDDFHGGAAPSAFDDVEWEGEPDAEMRDAERSSYGEGIDEPYSAD